MLGECGHHHSADFFCLRFQKSLSHEIASAESGSFLSFLIWNHIFICNERFGTTAAERNHTATMYRYFCDIYNLFLCFVKECDKQIT